MSEQQNTKTNHSVEEDEIDLIALAKTLWKGRKTVIKTTLIFMGIGLFVAIFSQKEYTASTTLVPQTSSGTKIGGNLGGLAAMAGINLGSMGSESGISPSLYPQIINSIPFQKELLQTPLTIEGQLKPITYTNYYENVYSPSVLGYLKKYTIGLPGLLIKAIKSKPEPIVISSAVERGVEGSNIQSITNDEFQLIKQLNDQLVLDVNDKDGYVSISTTMPEALASAELAKRTQALLQQYIIDFKVKKSQEQLKFIQGRYQEKEKEFKNVQQKLAHFKDRNRNVNSALAQTTLADLQSQYDLAYGVYAELAKQLETQQIQVKEDTPVFTILKPVSVPIEKTKPKRILILVVWTFLGGVLGIGMVFGRDFLKTVGEHWNRA